MILAVLTAFLSFYHNTKHSFHNTPSRIDNLEDRLYNILITFVRF